MIIKGKSVGGAKRLAIHLTRVDTNERAEVREIFGVAAEDLRGALLEMEAVASGSRTGKPFYHASINTRADERLSEQQRAFAISELEKKLGLSGQPRVVVVHEKEGREHCHIVWSRIDLDRMAAISDSHNYRKHEEVARDLERTFGHERVQGAHAEREGKERPDRTPSHAEMLAAERGAVSPQDAKTLVTVLWRGSDSGQSFKAALERHEWVLARGDRRDFVVIDHEGGTHSLARRVEGAKAKDIRARMADVNPDSLPSVAEARAIQRARHPLGHEPSPQVPQPDIPKERPLIEINIDHALADKDVKRTDAERELKKAAWKDTQALRKPSPGRISPERAFADAAREQAQRIRKERREEVFKQDQAAWKDNVKDRNPEKAKPLEKGLRVVDSATGAVTGLGEFILDFLSGSSPQPKRLDANDPIARAQQNVSAINASRRAEAAIESIRQDIQEGRNLKSEDIKNLTPARHHQIRAFGDSAVQQMVDEARKHNERYWRGDERERER